MAVYRLSDMMRYMKKQTDENDKIEMTGFVLEEWYKEAIHLYRPFRHQILLMKFEETFHWLELLIKQLREERLEHRRKEDEYNEVCKDIDKLWEIMIQSKSNQIYIERIMDKYFIDKYQDMPEVKCT